MGKSGEKEASKVANGFATDVKFNSSLPPPQQQPQQQKSRHRNKTLPEKEFKVRPSLLTEMLKIKEIQTVHNIILAVFVHFVAYSALSDYMAYGSLDLGFSNLKVMFGEPFLTFSILGTLHLIPILVMYPVFRFWAHLRTRTTSKSIRTGLDITVFFCLGNIFLVTFYIPIKIHFGNQRLPMACSAAIVLEQLRIVMKMYAFIRTNVPRVLSYRSGRNHNNNNKKVDKTESKSSNGSPDTGTKNSKEYSGQLRQRIKFFESQLSKTSSAALNGESESSESQDQDQDGRPSSSGHDVQTPAAVSTNETKFKYFDDNLVCPSLKKFVFFLYCPTIVYRDHYPRSNSRRWGFIFWHTAHALGSIFFYSLIHQRIGYVLLQNFGPKNPMTAPQILTVFSYQIVVGGLGYILAWVILLHSIQNIFGELLRFGDRGFYRDWWNSVSMSQYHRTWNTPVQDFLYTYVYKDAWKLGLGKHLPWMPALLVFSISNFWHEYAISYVTQFFCPVMMLMFAGPGTFLTFIPNKKFPQLGNIFMHWSMALGHGLIHMFYTMEHFSRENECPPSETALRDFFIPRFLSCDAVRWT